MKIETPKKSEKVRYTTINNNLDFIKLMARRAGQFATNEKVDQFSEKYWLQGKALAIFNVIQGAVTGDATRLRGVKYVRDPVVMDTLRWPNVLIERIEKNGRAAGDCDCKTMLLASCLMNRGYPVRFIAAHLIQPKETRTDRKAINHVYLEFKDVYGTDKDKWLPVEPSSKNGMAIGTRAPNVIDLYRVYVTFGGNKVDGGVG